MESLFSPVCFPLFVCKVYFRVKAAETSYESVLRSSVAWRMITNCFWTKRGQSFCFLGMVLQVAMGKFLLWVSGLMHSSGHYF